MTWLNCEKWLSSVKQSLIDRREIISDYLKDEVRGSTDWLEIQREINNINVFIKVMDEKKDELVNQCAEYHERELDIAIPVDEGIYR